MRTGEKARPSNEIMAECVRMVLQRLFEGDRYKVEACFDLLAGLARNHEGTLDARIAEALQNCTLNDLDRIDENARTLLPKDEPLANGIQWDIFVYTAYTAPTISMLSKVAGLRHFFWVPWHSS